MMNVESSIEALVADSATPMAPPDRPDVQFSKWQNLTIRHESLTSGSTVCFPANKERQDSEKAERKNGHIGTIRNRNATWSKKSKSMKPQSSRKMDKLFVLDLE
jgi:hypothetical protein